jgi:hypothetical protein
VLLPLSLHIAQWFYDKKGSYYIQIHLLSIQTTCPSPLLVQIQRGILDSFMQQSYPASLWNVGVSTQVPVRA